MNLGITTNNVAELEAVRHGLMSAWNLGFKFVILNLYSTLFIQWLTKKGPYAPYLVHLIDDCRNLIGWTVHLLHVYLETNVVAKRLAKRGSSQEDIIFVYEICPIFI